MSDIKVPHSWDADGWNGKEGYPQAYLELETGAAVEFETGGFFTDATLMINGKPVHNCTSIEFSLKVGELARATITIEDVPIRFKGRMEQESEA